MPDVKATVLTALPLLLVLRALLAAVRALLAWTRPLDTAPDAVLLLGGSEPRERAALLAVAGAAPRPRGLDRAAAAALTSRSTPVYVSSPACPVVRVARGIDPGLARRVRLDECAVDTLTNFTTLLPLLTSARRVLVLTSRAHVRRAAVLAWIVLGSGGVRPTVAVVRADTGEHPESITRLYRDAVRAIVWVLIGVSGAAVGRIVHGERFRHTPKRARRLERG